ncbi:hypothetical protein pb186bvf_015491 [Paramecium bursaria]
MLEKSILLIFVLLIFVDQSVTVIQEEQDIQNEPMEQNHNKFISEPDPDLKNQIYVQYQLQRAIQQLYGNKYEIYGENYPIGNTKQLIVSLLTYFQYGFILLLMFGDNIMNKYFPQQWNKISQNKVQYGAGAYFILNIIISSLSQSGAFEVFVGGKLVHSKLITGELPSIKIEEYEILMKDNFQKKTQQKWDYLENFFHILYFIHFQKKSFILKMLGQRVINRFAKMIIPYNHKGLKPQRDRFLEFAVASKTSMKTYVQDFNAEGFIFAFNNLISSINDDDFLEFARSSIDLQLARRFEDGLDIIRSQNQKIEIFHDDEIEEDLMINKTQFHFGLDIDTPFYDQSPSLSMNENNVFFQQPNLQFLELGMYIKCKTSLKLPNQNHYPHVYHYVQFLGVGDKPLKNGRSFLSQFMKEVEIEHWRIVNIDNFLKYQE